MTETLSLCYPTRRNQQGPGSTWTSVAVAVLPWGTGHLCPCWRVYPGVAEACVSSTHLSDYVYITQSS